MRRKPRPRRLYIEELVVRRLEVEDLEIVRDARP